jgi:hypothetical protein
MSQEQERDNAGGDAPIIVKFMAKNYRPEQYDGWRRQLPDERPEWGRCRFVFDPNCRTYDWLAVYDDLSPIGDERFSLRREPLQCPPKHTILITTEPSSIKAYGSDFLKQFGVILTSQEPWAIRQPHAVYTQPGLRWWYGARNLGDRARDGGSNVVSYDRMKANPPKEKTRLISTVCSNKHHGRSTMHLARLRFTERLQDALPELDRFGHGVRPIEDKVEALDPYRYHVTSENHIAPHYWTEKLADAFLGLTLPFYCGCPNVADYFPEQSYIPIDIRDFDGALEIIRRALADNEYEKRLADIQEARRRVLDEYNVFAGFSREIEKRHEPGRQRQPGTIMYSRRALRQKSVVHLLRSVHEKLRMKWSRAMHRSP